VGGPTHKGAKTQTKRRRVSPPPPSCELSEKLPQRVPPLPKSLLGQGKKRGGKKTFPGHPKLQRPL